MMRARVTAIVFCFAFVAGVAGAQQSSRKSVIVASKPFGESFLLAEMFAQALEQKGIAVERRPG
jgi:glycine betaine/choline ABC-type transport system substrate-binding protein